jgi:tripartite-type tricarboxylate transporter receptor subunit TctC
LPIKKKSQVRSRVFARVRRLPRHCPSTLGRPMLAPPGVPPERLKILRGAFVKTMKDPEFLAEIEKRNYELDPTPGENLEAIVKDVMSQPPAIIERLKMVLVAK